MSLYSLVSRGVAERLGQLPSLPGPSDDQASPKSPDVRLSGASMRLLEAGIALTALATAILIGFGR